MNNKKKSISQNAINTVYQTLDIITVILILTGQITNGGVFITPESFSLSLSGPFTGRDRKQAVEHVPQANVILDLVDVIAALLVIIGQINVIGTYVTSQGFTIVLGGPPFGLKKKEAFVPETVKFFSEYRKYIFEKCNIM